jgi:hypothetical protein
MDTMGLQDIVGKSTSKWNIRKEDQAIVKLEKMGEEIIVSEDSVSTLGKVKIINRDMDESLPDHKVKVHKVGEVEDASSKYSYEAKIIDDNIQHNTEDAQQDANKRRKTSDPLTTRRTEAMNNIKRL